MSMSNLTAPVPGEQTGYGSQAGPNPYVPGAGNGFLVTVPNLNVITRVVSLKETTGRLLCQIETVVAGDLFNQVRVRAYNPSGTILAAAIQAAAPINNHLAAAIQASAPVVDHAAADLQASAALNAHLHTITLAVDPGAANLVVTAGVLGVAGGAAGVTGIQNATQTYAAGVPTVHAFAAGVPTVHAYGAGVAVAGAVASECAGVDLSTYTFDVEAKGF